MVHGDIRHLEKWGFAFNLSYKVHGDIRHLEKRRLFNAICAVVHGDIRHLENHPEYLDQPILSSWRHTPFRNDPHADFLLVPGSWRHTPFRN